MTNKETRQRVSHEMAHAIARVLIASYFLANSLGLISDPNSMTHFLSNSSIPDFLRWPSVAFECLAALAIMIGFQTRQTSVMLALYVFWSSFILNYTPGDPVAIGAFWRDLASIGGLLLLYSHGRGRYALDNYLRRRELALANSEPVILQAGDETVDLAKDTPEMQTTN